jgi:hypothetical protein
MPADLADPTVIVAIVQTLPKIVDYESARFTTTRVEPSDFDSR